MVSLVGEITAAERLGEAARASTPCAKQLFPFRLMMIQIGWKATSVQASMQSFRNSRTQAEADRAQTQMVSRIEEMDAIAQRLNQYALKMVMSH